MEATIRVDNPNQVMNSATRMGSMLIEQGEKLVSNAKKLGEGPKPLRVLCFLGGVALLVTSIFPLLNIPSFFVSPPIYILEIYLMSFGFVCMAVESKDLDYLQRIQAFFNEWFKFLTVPAGKGLFYLLIGCLAISLWKSFILYLGVGVYLSVMGLLCVFIHLGMRRQLNRTGLLVDEQDEVYRRMPN